MIKRYIKKIYDVCKNYFKIPLFIGIIIIVTDYFGGFERVVLYYDNYNEINKLSFEDNEYGVLVCYFDNEYFYKENASGDTVNSLKARFEELKISNAKVKHDRYIFRKKAVSSFKEADELGQKYNADIVIWGSVTRRGIQPRIKIVKNSKKFKKYLNNRTMNDEMTIFKDSLKNISNEKAFSEIKFSEKRPELTDETVSLISFVVADQYFSDKNYKLAIKYFMASIPLDKTKFIDNEPAYIRIAISNVMIGNFNEALQILLKKTDYKNNNNILELIAGIRLLQKYIPDSQYKYFSKLYLQNDISDFDFFDQLVLYGIFISKDKLPDKNNQKIDVFIKNKIETGKNLNPKLEYLSLLYDLEEKNYNKYEKKFKKIFIKSDFNYKILLTLQALDVKKELFLESISAIKRQYGMNSSIKMLDIFYAVKNQKYEVAKRLIEKDERIKTKSIIGKLILSAYYSSINKNEEALKYANELVNKYPNIALFKKIRGDINISRNEYESAKMDYDIYLNEYNSDTSSILKFAEFSAQKNKSEFAGKYYTDLFKIPPKKDLNFREVIKYLLKKNHYDKSKIFIDEGHYNILKKCFGLINNNDVKNAVNYLNDNFLLNYNQELSDEYKSFYYYCLAILSYTGFFDGSYYLLKSYAEYPTEEVKGLLFFIFNPEYKNIENSIISKLIVAYKLYSSSNLKNAIITYKTLLKEYPDFCQIYKMIANLNFIGKNSKEEIRYLKKALSCNSNMKSVNYNLAYNYMFTDCSKSIIFYKKSLEVDGESYFVYDGLSRCYEKLNMEKEEREHYFKYKKLYFKQGGDLTSFFFYQPIRKL